MKSLDAIHGDFLDGCSLIEASAGTGKTYTIETLYLRLLVEKSLSAEQILVVTFTKLATAELQDRLRKVLLELRGVLREQSSCEDDRLPLLLEKWHGEKRDDAELQKICETALQDFDHAPIFTIHGFCQRMLEESAFESGVRFGRELLEGGDASGILKNGFCEFFRQQCYDETHPLRAWLVNAVALFDYKADKKTPGDRLGNPDALSRILFPVVNDAVADEEIAGGISDDEPDETLDEVEKFLAAWVKSPPDDENVKAFLSCMQHRELLPMDPESAISVGNLLASGQTLSGVLGDLSAMLIRYKAAVLRLAKRHAAEYLAEEKSRLNYFSYNDLINEVAKQVASSILLRDTIRRKYPCALIDEFQDTDPVQNSIFQQLYIKMPAGDCWPAAPMPSCSFFMIGDPKQAIYAFRGGDLPAYMVARESIKDEDHRFNLTTNFRSSKAFIDAMNKLFGKGSDFFVQKDLNVDVMAPDAAPELLLNGKPWSFDQWISHAQFEKDEDVTKNIIETIRRMLRMGLTVRTRSKDKVVDRPLNYGDFAILLKRAKNTNTPEKSPLKVLEKALTAAGIPCATAGSVNVFSRPQALTLQKLLQGLQDLGYLPKVARLMALPFFPRTPRQLEVLSENGLPHFQEWLVSLAETWRKRSVLAMFEKFLSSTQLTILGEDALRDLAATMVPADSGAEVDGIMEDLKKRTIAACIASSPDGHDALAVYWQLVEVLHGYALERRLGPTALLKELQKCLDRRNETSDIPDPEQLRMTSEKPAVRLMTIHKSKGLQFPCVFVHGMLSDKMYPPNFFHQADGRRIHLVDASLEGEEGVKNRNTGMEEMAAEALRLFYVAVTRARFLVRFFDTKINEDSALRTYLSSPVAAQNFPEVSDFLEPEVPADVSAAAPAENAPQENTKDVVAEEFPDVAQFPLHRGWHSNSFTSLSKFNAEASRELAELLKDDDENEAGPLSAAERALLPMALRLPRGTDAGTRWHELFEKLDFQASDEKLRTELPEKFASYGLLEDAWSPAMATERKLREQAALEMVGGVLNQELPRPLAPGEVASEASAGLGFRLRDVLSERRRAELRFTYWLKADGGRLLAGLAEALQAHGIQVPDAWNRTPTGALTGSIDLLFQDQGGKYYILDWKTNVIGSRLENYLYDGMKAEMDRHFYHLQYLIYTVAFLQFYRSLHPGWELTQASYDALFGGVFYVFLRGVSRGSGARGFFATRPTFELVQGVDAQLGVCENQFAH